MNISIQSEESLSESLSEALNPWESLLLYKPSKSLRRSLSSRAGSGFFQFIEDGVGPSLFCDKYTVHIKKMPLLDGKRATAPRLLRYIRLNINEFIDRWNTQFSPYGETKRGRKIENEVWNRSSPLGAIMHLDLFVKKANVEDATVMVTQASQTHWVFTTVCTPHHVHGVGLVGNGSHPVNGNRAFRIRERSDGSHAFYTYAADRPNGVLEAAANFAGYYVLKGQDALWRSLQNKVAAFVHTNGGIATIRKPVTRRFNWRQVKNFLDNNYCQVEIESEAELDEEFSSCIRTPGKINKFYSIKPGNTLLGIAGEAYGVGPGRQRLRYAQLINKHPYNQRFWRASGKSPSFPRGRISFNPRFTCDRRAQELAVPGAAPFGNCYATIFLPPKP